ncbi:leucine-rich repeat flightless-interacting protein 2 isoform X2 [Harmonia axyridis]|uniref:leucine-rich repeat flightless-interacting protein 2 isoform X2 n=1 Tax=Harmonia axyridis TaxID=115357 RepID=UPI001E27755B|nr:leucine-rich repeat flightless-interacting protein 2 isoform X2 [Harmonia axyridis]
MKVTKTVLSCCLKMALVSPDYPKGTFDLLRKLSRAPSLTDCYGDKLPSNIFHVATLNVYKKNAEERLRVKRQARAEAREIRMKELEKQQKEQEENADRQFDMLAEPVARTARTSISRYMSSRRSSEDSLEDGGSLRELRHELREVEDKFRKAMITNAQLDNEKSALTYQIELLKDKLQELEEEQSQLKREHKEKCREHDQMKRLCTKLKLDLEVTKTELDERDKLITEHGLVIVAEEIEETNGDISMSSVGTPKKSLVKVENAKFLENAGDGTLDVRLSRFIKEKRDLEDEINHLKLELEEEKSKKRKSHSLGSTNGPVSDYETEGDTQKDGSSLLADYKFRAQKAEQDVATLQATVARLESQVVRYKAASEASEKLEETLKTEKRKLQREARDAINRAEELETSNLHLLKRLDKLKNAKSTLLKEL